MFSHLIKSQRTVELKESSVSELLDVQYSKRARRMSLKLEPYSGRVKFVMPQHGCPARALEFIKEHEGWIRERVSKLPAPVPFRHGELINLVGEAYTIQVISSQRRTTKISIQDGSLQVKTNLVDPSPRIKRYLKELARHKIVDLAEDKYLKLNEKKSIKSVSIRDTKSRWGSCSEDGKLSFSWRLIFAPVEAFDYVIAHEVAHLVHMNHSKAFWSLCESLCVNYEYGRNWMDTHGNTLMRYGQNIQEP